MKRVCVILLLCLLSAVTLTALTGCVRPKSTVKDMDGYTLYENLHYGKSERQEVDLAIPEGASGEVGLMLAIHGGGWRSGDKSGHSSDVEEWCKKGYVSAAMNYRYSTARGVGVDEMLEDITLALETIRGTCYEAGIDVNKVMLYGGSAGAHLSLLYAYKIGSEAPIAPVAVCSMSGPTDLCDRNFYVDNPLVEDIIKMISDLVDHEFDADSVDGALPYLEYASPTSYIEGAVPTVICQGELDIVVPASNGYTLDALLTEAGVAHELIIFENSGHGLEADPDRWALMKAKMAEYAERYLK